MKESRKFSLFDAYKHPEMSWQTVIPWDRQTYVAIILLLMVAVFFWLPTMNHPEGWIEDMGDRTLALAGIQRTTILEYRQFPHWNPYMGGGLPLLANPHSALLSPTFLPILLAGEVIGTKIRFLLALYVGLIGAYFLGRQLTEGLLGPYVLAGIFMLSSWYPLYMWRGHEEFIALVYAPWVVLFFQASLTRLRYALLAGAFVGLMILEGGIYPVPYTMLLLSLYAGYIALTQRRLSPIQVMLILSVFAVIISGAKSLPMMDYLHDNPRKWGLGEPTVPLMALPKFFLWRDQLRGVSFPRSWYGWWEYGSYIGWIGLALAAIGLVLAWRRSLPWLLFGVIFLGFAVGYYNNYSPWYWLHKLPVFDSLHDTPRFRLITVLCIAIMGGIGMGRIWTLLVTQQRRRSIQWIFGIACLAATVALYTDLYLVSNPVYGKISEIEPVTNLQPENAFRQVIDETGNSANQAYPNFLQNRGLVDNYEPMARKPASVVGANEDGYRGEVWIENNECMAVMQFWSPNRLIYNVQCHTSSRLVVNQRFEKGWRSADGRMLKPHDGLISMSVTPSDSTITLFYRPQLFTPGCIVSLAGFLFLVGVFTPWGRKVLDLAKNKNLQYEFFFSLSLIGGIYCLYIQPVLVYDLMEVQYRKDYKIQRNKVSQPHHAPSKDFVETYGMEVTITSSIRQMIPFKIKFDDEITAIVLNNHSMDLERIKQAYGHQKLTDWINGYDISLNLKRGKNKLIVYGKDYGGNFLFEAAPLPRLTNYFSVLLMIVSVVLLLLFYLSATDSRWRPRLYTVIIMLLIVGLGFRLFFWYQFTIN